MKIKISMKAARKRPNVKAGEISISLSYVIRTKKDHLNIEINDWEQRLIAMNNHEAESHDANDL